MKKIKEIISKLLVFIIILGLGYYNIVFDDENISSNSQKRQIEVEEVIKETDTNLKIYFIDVGQADCILIEKNKEYALIDAGNNRDGKKLVAYFNALGIKSFKYIIGTHPHEDHIGGMDDIIKNFNLEHFYMPDIITTTRTFQEVLEELENKGIKYETPEIDSTFNLADAKFTTIFLDDNEQDLNNSSIILKLDYNNTSYLFMADAETIVENEILNKNIKSDVLKVGHHGTKYASSSDFLKKVQPKYSIITVGEDNEYGFPKEQVLSRLEKIHSKIYRTDKDGTIIITSDGENIKIDTIKTDTNGE